MKKSFSCAICNPPYKRSLHLEILEKVIPSVEEVINISPIRWLQDPLVRYKKNTEFHKFKESVFDHIEEVVDLGKMVEMDAEFIAHLGIIKCNVKGGYVREEKELLHKIISKLDPDRLMPKISIPKGNFCILPTVSNNRGDTTFMNAPSKISKFVNGKDRLGETYVEYRTRVSWGTNKVHDYVMHIEFETVRELDNFYDSLFTDFFTFVYNEAKTSTSPNHEFMPYMKDYSEPWTNERFCKYFDITGYISDSEAEQGSEWEEILKTMEKYK